MVEYVDYQCPYCAQAVGIIRELQYELGERLCYVVRHFPIVDLHREAMRAAEATEAAAAQNQFWHQSIVRWSLDADVAVGTATRSQFTERS